MHSKLQRLLNEKWWGIRGDPIDATRAECEVMLDGFNRWLDSHGIVRLRMSSVEHYEDLFLNQAAPHGDLLVENPTARVYNTERVLLVPKDKAEKLLFLGAP